MDAWTCNKCGYRSVCNPCPCCGHDVNDKVEPENSGMTDLLSAAIKTLNDNMHLCDGDTCTLKELRDAVAAIEPNWERTSEKGVL